MRLTAVAAAALTAAALTVPAPSPADSTGPPPVLVIGDSLEADAPQVYADALTAAGWAPRVEAFWGQQIDPYGMRVLTDEIAAGTLPDTVVMALGTNDAGLNCGCPWGENFTNAQWRARIDAALALTGPDRTVLWVNVVFSPPQVEGRIEEAEQLDRVLNRRMAYWRSLGWHTYVGTWRSYLLNYPGGWPYWSEEGIHYTLDGYSVRAAWIARRLAAVT
jgi:hypothetical protein